MTGHGARRALSLSVKFCEQNGFEFCEATYPLTAGVG
jgi:hypothetical protein